MEKSDKLQQFFGLSYASWLTLPRVLMENMPTNWQDKMAELLKQYEDAYPNLDNERIGTRVQIIKEGRLAKCPRWLIEYRRPDVDKIRTLKRGE